MVRYTNRLDNDGRYRVLIDAISYYRNRMGYTREKLAEKVGFSRQHMGRSKRPIW